MRVTRTAIPVLLIAALAVACGDDDEVGPDEGITLADFAGSWSAERLRWTSTADQTVFVDLIQLGGTLQVGVDGSGNFTGEAMVPDPGTGQLQSVPLSGSFVLVSQTTLAVDFAATVPPPFEDFDGTFDLSGDVLTILNPDSDFDFDGDGTEEPAGLEVILRRS